MEGARFGYAGAGTARVVSDDVEAAGLQRTEGRLVHLVPVDVQKSEIVIVEHQGHEIEVAVGEFGRQRILERPRDGGDRRGGNAGGLELVAAVGEGRRRKAARRGRGCRRGTCHGTCRRIGIAFGRRRPGRGLVGIARPALAIDGAGWPDRAGQQFRRVAAAGAEIEGGDAGTNGDEDQHLLRLAPPVVDAVGVAAIGARHDFGGLLGRNCLRLDDAGAEHDAKHGGQKS